MQDFMFACSVYPAEGAWLENVRLEAEDNIRRLRNHPSIAVWCGNNECNEAWFGWGWNTRYAKQGHPEWDRIIGDQLRRQYYEVLPEAVAALLARHALPPLVALVASRRHERKQRRRYAFLESVAQPRTDRRTTTPRAAASSANTASSRSPNTPPSCVSPPKSATGTSNRR